MDISKLCRSCMKEVASWEKENFDQKAIEMFCICTNIKISEEDKLPKQFCYDCTIRIESSFTFIAEAQKVDVTLKNIISRSQTSVIVGINNHTKIFIEYDSNMKGYFNEFESPFLNDIANNDNISHDNDVPINKIASKGIEQNCDVTLDNILKNENVVSMPNNTEADKNIFEEIFHEQNSEVNGLSVEQKHVCLLCHKSFATKTWFTRHMRRDHSKNQYTCTQCSKTFTNQKCLFQHLKLHSEESLHSCEVCTKKYKHRNQLLRHMRTHSDARPYICAICNMCFKIKAILRSHMKVHEGGKLFLCYICGGSFAQAGNLVVHMRTHTGEKPYKCCECQFECSVASSMRRHERRHRGNKMFLCKSCHKSFYDSSGLSRHKRTHTGELPYKCPHCTQSFLDSWKRKSHMMRHHRLALHEIPRMARDGGVLI